MSNIAGPPPLNSPITDYAWKEWLRRLASQIGGAAAGTFNALDFTSSNITSIVTRNHNDTQNVQGGSASQYYHLTEDHHSGLTAITSIANADSPYSILDTNGTILCDCTAGAITVNLPAVSGEDAGRTFTIKKIDASGNAVTVDGNASEVIDGATTQTLSAQWDFITIKTNGSAWYIVAN